MDDIKIFVLDPDGTVPEELVGGEGYLLLADEEDGDYPTDEEITTILSELDMEE